MGDYGLPQYQGDLNRNCVTIAEALKPAGYHSYMSGKWHVTPYKAAEVDNPDTSNWPLQRGFDRFYGTIHGAGSFFDPNSLTRNNTVHHPRQRSRTTSRRERSTTPTRFPTTQSATSESTTSAKRTAKPFFMYVAYTAAHWPMHALPQDMAKYEGKYDGGYTPARARNAIKQAQGARPSARSLGCRPAGGQLGRW